MNCVFVHASSTQRVWSYASWLTSEDPLVQSSILQSFSSSRADPLDWEMWSLFIFPIGSFPKCVYVYYLFIFLVVVCILFCVVQQKKRRRSRDENRHHGKGRTNEISVISLFSSYLRWEVSKEGQLSYPNFIRGLLFDDIQPLIGRFEILGTLCCRICEVSRRAENQKEAGLRDP